MVRNLDEVPLLSDLDKEVLEDFASVLEERKLADGELICEEGTPGDEFFLIRSGGATVSKRIDPEENREKVLSTLKTGDFFGEMALLEDAPRSANVRAAGPTTVLVLSRRAFRSLLERASDVAVRLLFGIISTVIGRLRSTSIELVALYDTGKIIGTVNDLPTLASKILERLMETIGMPQGLLLLVNPYSKKLEIQQSLGFEPGATSTFDLSADDGLLFELFSNRRPFFFNNFKAGSAAGTHGFETAHMLGAPFICGEQAVGAVILCDPSADITLDMNHLNLVLAVATQVAPAIENARRREEDRAKQLHARHFVTF